MVSSFLLRMLALAGLAACSSVPVPDSTAETSKELLGLEVSVPVGDDTMVESGKTQQLVAVSRYADDSRKDVTSDPAIVWSSSDATIATVGATGVVSAIHRGTVKITAAYKGPMADRELIIAP